MTQADKLLLLIVLLYNDFPRFAIYFKEYCEGSSGVSMKPASYVDNMGDNKKGCGGKYKGVYRKELVLITDGEEVKYSVKCLDDYYLTSSASETRRASFSRVPNLHEVTSKDVVSRRLNSIKDDLKIMSKEEIGLITLHYLNIGKSMSSLCDSNAMRMKMRKAIAKARMIADKILTPNAA